MSLPVLTPRGRLLAVDDGKGSLGDLPLRMLRAGVDVLHASEVDEAELLARQEGQEIRGVLLPAEAGLIHLDQSLEAVVPHTGIGIERVALLGARLDDREAERLRALGVRWRLWTPFEDRDLRFIGRLLVWEASDGNLRIDRRVPTALPARAIRRGAARPVLVGDLSEAGAFLETSDPIQAGLQLQLEIELPNREVACRAMVRWVARSRPGEPPPRVQGCGVEFLRPSRELRAVLREHLECETDRFRL